MSKPGETELVPQELPVWVCQVCGLTTLSLSGTLCGHMDDDFRQFIFIPLEGRG